MRTGRQVWENTLKKMEKVAKCVFRYTSANFFIFYSIDFNKSMTNQYQKHFLFKK